MKNVLVTGGCGFIGSNFVKYLISLENYFPIIVDKLTYAGSIENLKHIDTELFQFIEGDICDEQLLYRWGDLPILGSLLNIFAKDKVGTLPFIYQHKSHTKVIDCIEGTVNPY